MMQLLVYGDRILIQSHVIYLVLQIKSLIKLEQEFLGSSSMLRSLELN